MVTATTLRRAGVAAAVTTAGALGACAGAPAAPRPGPTPAVPNALTTPAASAEVWVTTGDRAKLLRREPDVPFAGAASDGALPVIVVDTATRYQSVLGFGAAFTDASVYLIQQRVPAAEREALLRELFGRAGDGIGLSFMRVTMGASDFSSRHYSYDDVPAGQTDPALARFSVDVDRPDKLPVIRAALAANPAMTLVASPWSPPAWMKTSNSLITGTLRPEAYDAFANYFVRFVRAYAAEGVPVAAVTVQNEPHFEPKDYPGMRLEPPARAAVIGRHLGPALERAGLRTQIWDWDHNWDEPQSPLAVLADPAARRYVRGVAWHCYGGDVGAQGRVRDAHPDKDVYFTECSGGRWAPDFGDNLKFFVGQLVIGGTRNWARGVALWNLALDERGGPHLGGCGDCRGVVTVNAATGAVTRNEEYYALAHASRFVRPGAVRVASTSGAGGLASVAFRNPDDGSTALVVLNGGSAAQAFAVRAGARGLRYTLPPASVATFTWR